MSDLDHVFAIDELAHGNVIFVATGVTDGFLLRGARFTTNGTDTKGRPPTDCSSAYSDK